jgi:site-specific DNA-cytosine methylase
MNVLELFSGTKSVGKICDELGWVSISVDLELPATHQCDIMDFDYKQYPKNTFDIIWASPPCTEYSAMNYCRPEKIPDIEGANKIVLKTLEIINYFNPKYYLIENPQTGTLKNQDFMKEMNYYDVDYCKYNHPIRKRTRIWTNLIGFKPQICKKDCNSLQPNGKHLSFSRMNIKGVNRLHLRYQIPPDLIRSLFTEILSQ